jgi:metallo-beta-lactamase family protein
VLGEFHRSSNLPDIPIYLDSPLAIKATKIFRKNKKYYDEEAREIVEQGHDPFDLPNLRFTESTKESMEINEQPGPAIVIAGSGMCTAGRIKHHLKHNLWREGASMVIIGFQAKGTTGRKIVDGAKRVKIFRENVAVRAKVFTIGGFSAHADQKDLLEWVAHFESNPSIFLVHGEPTASETLGQKIREQFDLKVHVPKWKDRLVLKARETALERPPEEAPLPDMHTAMLNTIVDLENEIKALTQRIQTAEKDEEITEYDVDRLKYVQEELKAVLS